MTDGNDGERVIADVRRAVVQQIREFFDELCKMPEAVPVDLGALERAQRQAAGEQLATAIAEFGAELVFAKPDLATQRRLPN